MGSCRQTGDSAPKPIASITARRRSVHLSKTFPGGEGLPFLLSLKGVSRRTCSSLPLLPRTSADHRELRRAGTAQISEFKPRGGNARGVRQIRLCCKHEAVAPRAQLGVELGGWQGVVCFCNHGAARARGMGGGRADRSRGEAGKAAWPQHCPPVLQGCRGGASKTSLLLQGGTFT